MDDPTSEGNGNIIDIFILSTDENSALLLKEHLGQSDYRVTVFTRGAQLKETLRAGKPNLLICDSSTEEQEGFEVCSQIKADEDLWVIPVLILTAASTIEDLLEVLDCNADNFIAQPYDLPDHLSLIENMLATPVERQTPDQIKKQFKIRHEDQTYVVAANRRKLLEYLLSAFEIVVNRSSKLSHVTSERQELSESLKELERTVAGQTEVIETINTTVLQKEQKIVALTRECEELEKVVVQKTSEIGNLMQEHDGDTKLITTHEETISAMIQEQEKVQITHRSQTDALTSQISTLAAQTDAQKTSLDTVQRELSEQTTSSTSLEETHRALTLEHEQLKSACMAEKNRAVSAEQEIIAVMQAKTLSEQELTRLKGELEAETNRRILTENQVVSLQHEFEQSELSSHSEIDALSRQVGKLQEMLTASAAALENEESITESQKEYLAGVIAEIEKTGGRFESVSTQLQEAQANVVSGELKIRSLADELEQVTAALETERGLRRTSEEKTTAAAEQQEKLEQHLRTAHEEMERAKKDQDATVRQFKEEIENAYHQVNSLETNVSNLATEKLLAEQDVQALTYELEHARAALADERKSHLGIDEGHAVPFNERPRVQQSLFPADGVTTPKENIQLITSNEQDLPMPVEPESQSITTEITPGLQQPPVYKKDLVSGELSGDIPRVFSGLIPRVPEISGVDSIFMENEPVLKKVGPASGPGMVNEPAEDKTGEKYVPEESHVVDDKKGQLISDDNTQPGKEATKEPVNPDDAVACEGQSEETPEGSGETVPLGDISFNRNQWLDLLKWAHHSGSLSQDQRLKIIRMGRLIQKDRKLTNKQQDQVREILALVYALGYRSR